MNIIETKGLCYSYDGERLALDKADISIRKGSATAILGGNGAGKSTLFLALNGVLSPTAGEVYYLGQKVSYGKAEKKELRKKVGIVFQDPNDQLFSADVYSDIAFGPLNMGKTESEVKQLVSDVIKQLNIGNYMNRPTHALSFGQKKRVAIAGILAMQPEVIILDEPTAGLDPCGISEMLALLNLLQKERGLTVIISTHDIDLVPLLCDFAYVLRDGKVVMEGTWEQLFLRADELREHHLRLPRLAHLMEILKKKDHLPVDETAATISRARRSIKSLL